MPTPTPTPTTPAPAYITSLSLHPRLLLPICFCSLVVFVAKQTPPPRSICFIAVSLRTHANSHTHTQRKNRQTVSLASVEFVAHQVVVRGERGRDLPRASERARARFVSSILHTHMYPFISTNQQLRLDGPAMGDYGGNWRYGAATDGRRAGSTPTKRSRRDYEDGLPRTGYGAARDRDVGYPRDRVYEDQLGRAGWRDGDGLGGGGDLMGYGGGGLGANDLGLGPGLGPGLGGGGLGPLGIGIPDESQLMGRGMGPLDVGMGGRPGGLGLNGGAPEPDVLRAGLDVLPPDASSTLFVDGLPQDCSRREAAHIFRPFIGFKEVRLVHKDAKRADGGKVVLCFVEFADARCAATALEALQGYKFDETDHESYVLRLTFARHPGPRGPARDDPYRGGRDRGDDYNNRSRGGGGGRR